MKRYALVLLLIIAGCSSSIDKTVKQGSEGFVIGNGTVGVLLSHGLAATPYEVEGLAKYLSKRNITVYVVRLSGHGTSVEDLKTRKWTEWYDDYRNAYASLKSTKKKVFVGGMSLGGILALKLAEDDNVSGVIALAPAIEQRDKKADYAWILKYFVKYSSRTLPDDVKGHAYDKFPVSSVAQMVDVAKITRNGLNKITEPILIMQYSNDTRVSPDSSRIVYDSVSSYKKDIVLINGTGHVFLLDKGRDSYFEKIYEFIMNNSQQTLNTINGQEEEG